MPTFETPVQVEHQATATITFDCSISGYEGPITLRLTDPNSNNDEVPIASLIAAIDASADWTFTGGSRGWPVGQAITP